MSLPTLCHSRERGNPWPDLSEKKEIHAEAQRTQSSPPASLRPLRRCVSIFLRHPSVGWGPFRLSSKLGANRLGDIGPSLRWGDGVCGGEGML